MQMQLRDFIAQTLTQIVEGVQEAQRLAKDKGALVNPAGTHLPTRSGDPPPVVTQFGSNRFGQLIEFDVVLTTSESEQTKGGAGVFVAAIAIGSQAQLGSDNIAVNRVKFAVPLFLPFG